MEALHQNYGFVVYTIHINATPSSPRAVSDYYDFIIVSCSYYVNDVVQGIVFKKYIGSGHNAVVRITECSKGCLHILPYIILEK